MGGAPFGGTSGSAGSQDAGGTGGADSGRELSRGSAKLIDVFVGQKGVYAVFADAVSLIDRSGQELKRIAPAREVTAAAFDGSLLVVADRAKFTTYDVDLSPVASSELVESCASAVLVKGARFVCGPTSRKFYTFDAVTGALLASSVPGGYQGITMRRVPATDDFVIVPTDISPPDFYLLTVSVDHRVTFVNESPYHGDVRATDVYGFNGVPPTHLVTEQGLMLRMYGDGCAATQSPQDSKCFVKDGVLGTLFGPQAFVGMDTDQSGKLYGIVNPTPVTFESSCKDGCTAQRVDPESHTIEMRKPVYLNMGKVIALRRDTQSSFVVGYRMPGPYRFDSDPYPGHRVVMIDLE